MGWSGGGESGELVGRRHPSQRLARPPVEAWLRPHPERRGGGLRDDDVLFISPRARETACPVRSPSTVSRRSCAATPPSPACPNRLAHPHALRGYYATTLAGERVPIYEIKARLGHASIETTARYLVELGDERVGVGDGLDRHHEHQRRSRGS